jgi:hypothetical protein
LLATLAQARQPKVVVALHRVALELREEDTRHILLLRAHAEPSLLCGLLDLVAYVAADRVRDLGQGKCCDLHDAAHLALRLIDAACDFSEASGKDALKELRYPYGRVNAYLVRASLFRLSRS